MLSEYNPKQIAISIYQFQENQILNMAEIAYFAQAGASNMLW